MKYHAIDCMGFAGGFTLGMVQAGFDLIGKREMTGGFGVANCEVNRHLLGDKWNVEVCDPSEWSTLPAEVVFGNPPCSGFSVMSAKEFRGASSKINHCMWAFTRYAARVMPQIAVFESVQQAYSDKNGGRDLMRALRGELEDLTNERWNLFHVKHNAYGVGGAAQRKRYFWLASRVPFGIDIPQPRRLPTLFDVIGDLENTPITWEPQPYRAPASWWSNNVRRDHVDGHHDNSAPAIERIKDLMTYVEWKPREHVALVARRCYETHGRLPPSWASSERKIVERDFYMGYTTPTRWDYNQPARVITGGALGAVIHPVLPRTVTHRETARILGFPDDWLIKPLRGMSQLGATWGKGITVQCGRWIGGWIRAALDGTPGTHVGIPVGDREWLIDVTHSYKNSVQSTSLTSYAYAEVLTNKVRRGPMTEVVVEESTVEQAPEYEGTEIVETEDSAESKSRRGRGRPRPQDTVERDELVLRTVRDLTELATRESLAAATGMKPGLVYLSLYRLRRAGHVERKFESGQHIWVVVTQE